MIAASISLTTPALATVSARTPAAATAEIPTTTTVPWVLNDPAALAVRTIQRAGLLVDVRGPQRNAFVGTQSPAPGTVVPLGSTVTIATIVGPTP
ncbi:MAG TPA: PASTA domain-containing protein [Mycobacteriales bacterium]|nr:PASTA domain-containing protein [Mycobacteriales bacterium]